MRMTVLASDGFLVSGHHGHVTDRIAPDFAAEAEERIDPPIPEVGILNWFQTHGSDWEWVVLSNAYGEFRLSPQNGEAAGLDLYSKLKLLGRNLELSSSADTGVFLVGKADVKIEGRTGYDRVRT